MFTSDQYLSGHAMFMSWGEDLLHHLPCHSLQFCAVFKFQPSSASSGTSDVGSHITGPFAFSFSGSECLLLASFTFYPSVVYFSLLMSRAPLSLLLWSFGLSLVTEAAASLSRCADKLFLYPVHMPRSGIAGSNGLLQYLNITQYFM